jgi:catalase
MMDIAEELKHDFDPLDATKTWPEDIFPLLPVGKMVLNWNPENYFGKQNKSRSPQVPSFRVSNRLLTSCCKVASSRTRIPSGIASANYLQLAINRPHVPVDND